MIDWSLELKKLAPSVRQALADALDGCAEMEDVIVIMRRNKDAHTDTFVYHVNEELTSGGAIWMLEHCKLKLLTEK